MNPCKLKVLKVIKETLDTRGWNWFQLSKRAEITLPTLKNWRDEGEHPKNILILKRIAKALSISLHYLCYKKEDDCLEYAEIVIEKDSEKEVKLEVLILKRKIKFHESANVFHCDNKNF